MNIIQSRILLIHKLLCVFIIADLAMPAIMQFNLLRFKRVGNRTQLTKSLMPVLLLKFVFCCNIHNDKNIAITFEFTICKVKLRYFCFICSAIFLASNISLFVQFLIKF